MIRTNICVSSPRFSTWLPYWTWDQSLQKIDSSLCSYEFIHTFIHDLGSDGSVRFRLKNKNTHTWNNLKKRVSACPKTNLVVTVVNDVFMEKGLGYILKADAETAQIISSYRKKHIQELLKLIDHPSIAALDIDYENISGVYEQEFTHFIKELSLELKAKNKKLFLTVHPKWHWKYFWKSKAKGSHSQNWTDLEPYIDRIQIMAYNMTLPRDNPGPVCSKNWLYRIAEYSKRIMPPEKISIALKTGSGLMWENGKGRWINAEQFENFFLKSSTEPPQLDPKTLSSYYRSKDGSRTIWFEDAQAISAKVHWLNEIGVANIIFWQAGSTSFTP